MSFLNKRIKFCLKENSPYIISKSKHSYLLLKGVIVIFLFGQIRMKRGSMCKRK